MDTQLKLLEAGKGALIGRLRSHPFLQRCREGAIQLDELKVFLAQQGLYSAYFTRYLCAMMANLPSNREVLALAENLFEELGLEPDSPQPHHEVYRSMLYRFEVSLESAELLPGTSQLIDTMFRHCRDTRPSAGLGALCLGAEALVPAIYGDIVAGFRACGAADGDIEFFLLHIECDDGHAETIRDIMVDIAAADPGQLGIMLAAGSDLVEARLRFFDSIEAACRGSQPQATHADTAPEAIPA
ncbi:iron-containing redox enzyme family protein [Microbulbifer thermotolerans]|uniref:TenA family transcriptional regulator n=1 Tax=Microbulbifer thermotolerans TaxID=252514 RepID=UPI0022495DFB|nr:iron-containing redox enzyme family protein [Microbulbifer thermotolerans]MCX2796291.1 iron-containing redox enzyme family protein [Microbulbifer thermotolerans]